MSGVAFEPATGGQARGHIRAEHRGPVVLITIDRPDTLNSLSEEVSTQLSQVLLEAEADISVRAIVVTGSKKAFARTDVSEMQSQKVSEVLGNEAAGWRDQAAKVRKPVIAAVAGYALGAGAELAMMCDFIIAADTAKFGHPEITLGVFPGAGGTQRLARFVGKAKAMDMVLTGRIIEAGEAESMGLVARVVPAEDLVEEAMSVAQKIAGYSGPSVKLAKAAINRAFETPLEDGLRFERRLFRVAWATEGRKEGLNAFVEKRRPSFTHR